MQRTHARTRTLTKELDHVLLVGVGVRVDVLEQLDLVQTLVEEVFVVLDDFNAHLREPTNAL